MLSYHLIIIISKHTYMYLSGIEAKQYNSRKPPNAPSYIYSDTYTDTNAKVIEAAAYYTFFELSVHGGTM